MIQCLKPLKKMVSTIRNKIFLKYWSFSNGFKENMNERISFLLNRKAVIKYLFKMYFHEMEKLLPVERIFDELEQNGFHEPENQFPLARIKNLL